MARPAIESRPLTADQQALAADNIRLVGFVLKRHFRAASRADRDDLRSVGHLALVDAAAHFDPSRSKFSTYATRLILGRMLNHVRRVAMRALPVESLPNIGPAAPADTSVEDRDAAEVAIARSGFTPRERIVFRLVHGEGHTLAEVGRRLNRRYQGIQEAADIALAKAREANCVPA